jgi:hypothetical protein
LTTWDVVNMQQIQSDGLAHHASKNISHDMTLPVPFIRSASSVNPLSGHLSAASCVANHGVIDVWQYFQILSATKNKRLGIWETKSWDLQIWLPCRPPLGTGQR